MLPVLLSCNDDKNEPGNYDPVAGATIITATPSISTTDLTSDATEFTLIVKADADWRLTSDSDWLTHMPNGGVKNEETKVVVRVAANKGFDARDGVLSIKSGSKTEDVKVHQNATSQITVSNSNLLCGSAESAFEITVNSNTSWNATCDASWFAISPASGAKGESTVVVKVSQNTSNETREGAISFSAGEASQEINVTQYSDAINIPEGYSLVWHDEFNEGTTLSSDWTIEVQPSGWVNNELQNYVKSPVDGKYTYEIENGFLNINCFKGSDGKVYSARVYAKPREGWTYGYFEASINLPSGKGTWPAFWMMPVNFTGWPDSGEMDIMEEVGVVPNEVSSSLHARGHYHVENTQVTAARMLPGAEGEFHTYAMEWTPDLITTFVDGVPLLTYANDGTGDRNWPYHNPFYLILNLAWGGDWGGMRGVDESALPVTMKVDYVRVFQKK